MTSSRLVAGRRTRFGYQAALLAVVLIFFAQLALGSTRLSLTSDEPPHTAHGYLLLRTGDTWALDEHRHPPLLNVWSAWPLLLQPERPDVTTVQGWGEDFVVFVRNFWPELGPVDRWAFATRLPNMLLAILLMALVSRWARTSFGRAGALTAVLVMAFDPTMVAHAQLNTTDVGTALLTFACIFSAARYGKLDASDRRKDLSAAATGILAGATAAAKGSGLIVLPIALTVMLWHEVRAAAAGRDRGIRLQLARAARAAVAVAAGAFLALWAAYGFRLEAVPGTGVRLPLVAHAEMVRRILSESRRVAFLMGDVRWGGWWWYFPLAFAIKTSIPSLILLAGAAVSILRRAPYFLARPEFWLYPGFYILTSVVSGMNIGYRHLLSVFPFAYLAVAQLASELTVISGARSSIRAFRLDIFAKIALISLLGWQAAEALSVAPFGLAYFNEFVGGPTNGYKYLVDSNYDWGQSFKALAGYLSDHDIDETWLSYYTWIDPAVYGITYRPLPPAPGGGTRMPQPYAPLPGTYALSATPMQGVMLSDVDTYDWFRHRDPTAQPGYGILLYDVSPAAVEPAWIAQCDKPAIPLNHDAIVTGFGRDNLREVIFDCTQGWIFPDAGATPGWYAVHRETAEGSDDWLDRRLAATALTFEQREPRTLPAFSLYEWQTSTASPPTLLAEQPDIGPMTLLGFRSRATGRPGETIAIETWWRVDEIPERPLSLMLHMGRPGETPIGIGDGLAVPKEVWAVGDIIVQNHRIDVPADASGAYAALTGGYWLDTLERMSVAGSADETSVTLLEIEVKGGS